MCSFDAKMLTGHARETHLRINFLIMRINLHGKILVLSLCNILITVISIGSIHGMFRLDNCDGWLTADFSQNCQCLQFNFCYFIHFSTSAPIASESKMP